MNDIINHTIEREGGYVNHEDDRGGATKYDNRRLDVSSSSHTPSHLFKYIRPY